MESLTTNKAEPHLSTQADLVEKQSNLDISKPRDLTNAQLIQKHLVLGRLESETDPRWRAVREICCETADSGEPISRPRWKFFSEIWVGPYQKFCPERTWVAEIPRTTSGESEVAGYITTTLDTGDLEIKKNGIWKWKMALWALATIPFTGGAARRDRIRFLKRAFGIQKSPEQCFDERLTRLVRQEFPAHLHMNVRASYRGFRIGERLVRELFDSLIVRQVSGCHLYCGPKPKAFYERLGFRVIHQIEFRPGVWVYLMGCRIFPQTPHEGAD